MPKKKNESLDSSSVSDDLITVGRNSGQFKSTFKYNIVDGDGKVCEPDSSGLATQQAEILRRISWCEWS